MTEERLNEIRRKVDNANTIGLLQAAREMLAALDDEIAGRSILRCNDVRLELLATTPPEAHDAINALFARIEIPVGPMYERDRLRAEVDRLQRFEREYADIVATLKSVGASFHDDPCADIRLLASDSAFQRVYIKRADEQTTTLHKEIAGLTTRVALQAHNALGTSLVLASQEDEIDRLKRERDEAFSQIRVEDLWQRHVTAALDLSEDAGLGAVLIKIETLRDEVMSMARR